MVKIIRWQVLKECLHVIANATEVPQPNEWAEPLRVGGVLQVLLDNVRWACGCGGVMGGEVLTRWHRVPIWPKAPNLSAAPGFPAPLFTTQQALLSPDRWVLARRARPLLPVPSWGFLHAGRRAKSKRRVHNTVISAQVNLIPWVDFFFCGGEKLLSAICVTSSYCYF